MCRVLKQAIAQHAHWAAGLLAFSALATSSDAIAQAIAPSQILPTQLRPVTSPTTPSSITLPEHQADVPAVADLHTTIGDLVVVGGLPHFAATEAQLRSALVGKDVTLAQIYSAASELERQYVHAGYVLTRVTVPPQTLSPGSPLRLVVTQGYIEEVVVDGVPQRLRHLILARTRALINRRPVTLAEIERQVLLAGDLPGVRLRSALARGSKAGGVRLVLAAEFRTVNAALSVDNLLPQSLGTWQANLSLAFNDTLGLGEQTYFGLGSQVDLDRYSFPTSPTQIFAAGMILPLGANGPTLNPEYVHSRTQPRPAAGTPAVVGRFDRFALRASYSLIRNRSQTLRLSSGLEHIAQTLDLIDFGTQLSHDSYWQASLGLNWQALLPTNGPVLLDFQFAQGVGGRDQLDAKYTGIGLSRQKATPDAAHITATLHINQPLPAQFGLNFTARGQSDFGHAQLLPGQFALDAADGLSAFTSGSFNVDRGATLRGELEHPLQIGRQTLAPYGFGAIGWGGLEAPTSLEASTVRASSYGAGVRTTFGPRSIFNLSAELGRQDSDVAKRPDETRVRIAVGVQL